MRSIYGSFAEFERRGEPAYAASILEQSAGLTPAEAAQVRAQQIAPGVRRVTRAGPPIAMPPAGQPQ